MITHAGNIILHSIAGHAAGGRPVSIPNGWELFHMLVDVPSYRSGNNIRLTHSHFHELCKKVLI